MTDLQIMIKELFDKGEIEALLGWKLDEKSKSVHPHLFKSEAEISDIIFDETCVHNLTNYLPTITERYQKVGILLKGCDGRSLTTQLVEHRIAKNKVVALALACDGVKIDGKTAEKCEDCAVNVSPIADFNFGEKRQLPPPSFNSLKVLESMTAEERWHFFAAEFEKCTRCNACRQICPLCYCEICITDQQEPKWIEPSSKLSSNTMWHLVRAYHLAGRCSDCGECDRVCPQNLPLRLLNNSLEKSVIEMFKVRPGTVSDELPPLVTLAKEDSDDIMGGKL